MTFYSHVDAQGGVDSCADSRYTKKRIDLFGPMLDN